MRAPYAELYLHCVWATWDRLPLITNEIQLAVHSALRSKSDAMLCPCLAIGGMPDHVHGLVRLHTTVPVADLLKGIKGASSHLMTHLVHPGEFCKWQGAYGAFTVSKQQVPQVISYIERQKQHHAGNDLWSDWEQTLIDDDGVLPGG